MNSTKLPVYCLECCELKPCQEGAVVFRTGFYQTRYPLGFCPSCAERRRRNEATGSSNPSGNSQASA